jgi:BatD DUF11 like domain
MVRKLLFLLLLLPALLLAEDGDNSEKNDLSLKVDLSNKTPYKNEPFIYTVKLISKSSLSNIRMQKVSIEDAIVDLNGEPKVYQTSLEGMAVTLIEFSYLITPLKPGNLTIPSNIIQGEIQERRRIARGSTGADNEFEGFSIFQAFERYKPFALKVEPMELEVQAPVASVTPWLPARSLIIEEAWNDSQPLQVGEPLTRRFKIVAEGIKSSQLPALNSQLTQVQGFKAYADKPELADEIRGEKMLSSRTEEYTLIPQSSGTLTLPEISISWWDVTKKEKVTARIPSKTLQILPAPISQRVDQPAEPLATHTVQLQAAPQNDPLLYLLIGILATLLLVVLTWVIVLQRKISSPAKKSAPKSTPKVAVDDHQKYAPPKDKREKLPDLNPT